MVLRSCYEKSGTYEGYATVPGLDYDHCAFDDGDNSQPTPVLCYAHARPCPVQTHSVRPSPDIEHAPKYLISFCFNFDTCANPDLHRKVYSYRRWGNAVVGDRSSGHGTHVIGSAAADPSPASGFAAIGAAPGAKVAVEDSSTDVDDDLYLPTSLVTLFETSASQGVRIYSGYVRCGGHVTGWY
eukprot:3826571-Rhodomonas_salina.4